MSMILAVASGGAIGAVLRYVLSSAVARWLGSGFPWGTLAVNVLGAFVMGMCIELFVRALPVTQELRAFVVVGILGALTTFSTFSLDTVFLAERGEWILAASYVVASVVLSIGALVLAMWMFRAG
ncbi:MAG: fluoride efflux transporter CrcB [Rickettsiales bacterium]|nr:fluoride efflux transporter CrcB [Rickettsiales bacterium]